MNRWTPLLPMSLLVIAGCVGESEPLAPAPPKASIALTAQTAPSPKYQGTASQEEPGKSDTAQLITSGRTVDPAIG